MIILSMKDVGMAREGRVALQDVNLDINRGDFVAVTGPNGGGKTTLLRIMLRLLRPSTGVVEHFDATGARSDSLRVGYLPQKNSLDSRFPITVSDLISSGLMGTRGLSRAERTDLTRSMIAEVGLERHTSAVIGTLSGGQMQRALMGRAIIGDPELLVLDEPLSYVDKQFEQRIYQIVERMASKATIVLVSHEMSTIAAMANRHVMVDRTLSVCHARHHEVHCDCGTN